MQNLMGGHNKKPEGKTKHKQNAIRNNTICKGEDSGAHHDFPGAMKATGKTRCINQHNGIAGNKLQHLGNRKQKGIEIIYLRPPEATREAMGDKTKVRR